MSIFKPVDHQKRFVIGTPLVGWKCDRGEHLSWLKNRKEISEKFPNASWFSALETDSRGLAPFQQVTDALAEVKGTYWTYSLNDGEKSVTTVNRLIRIEMARNLIREYAQRSLKDWWRPESPLKGKPENFYTAILYIDSDVELTVEMIEKLLEVNHPMVGINIPNYCLRGRVICENPLIEEFWNTAAILLVNSPSVYDVPWSHNAFRGWEDDQTFQTNVEIHGYGSTWVRKDIKGFHDNPLILVENRGIPDRE